MTVADRLRAMIEANPPDGSVLIPVARMRAWLDEDGGQAHTDAAPLADLTVEQVATEIGRAPSTVRTWCARGRLPRAYKLNGREWRIPRGQLRAFLDSQCEGNDSDDGASENDGGGLGGWREHFQGREGA